MKKYSYFVFVLVFLIPLFSIQSAEEFKFISTEDLSKGIQENQFIVFDCNSRESYEKMHIPSAAHMDVIAPNLKIFPSNKETPLVFYCKNDRCTACHDGARFAKKNGYKNIEIYPLGIDGWMKAGMKLEAGKKYKIGAPQ